MSEGEDNPARPAKLESVDKLSNRTNVGTNYYDGERDSSYELPLQLLERYPISCVTRLPPEKTAY